MNKLLLLLLFPITGQAAAQCITLNNCPPVHTNYFPTEPNSTYFWQESYWTNPDGVHDLSEAPVALSLQATNTCPGQSLSFRYLLFLDTDHDNIQETVINSGALPGFNLVYFNNYNNPNYTGGTPAAFDERAVPANQKYGFAIQEIANGTSKTAYVKWNSQGAPTTYTVPKLPFGNHRIKWFVTNGLGEEKTCEYTFQVVEDTKKPTVVCLTNNVMVNILPTQMITIFDADFLFYMEDNVTTTPLLQSAIRKAGTTPPGPLTFPQDSLGNPIHSISFDCSELGFHELEIWSRDEAGNADYCQTYVTVNDDLGNCAPVGTTLPNSLEFQVNAAPNPFFETLQINIHSERTSTLALKLFDPKGLEVFCKTETIGAGDSSLQFPVASLPSGVYFLWMEDASGARHLEKIIKQ